MAIETLADAFLDEIRDVLSADRQMIKALPKMIDQASSAELRKTMEEHLVETRSHVERVIAIFEELGKAPRAKHCKAMEGLLAECAEMLEEDATPAVMDAVIIALAQKVEHYEIANYGTLASWAKTLGYGGCHDLLVQSLADEEAADKKLSKLAQKLNQAALQP